MKGKDRIQMVQVFTRHDCHLCDRLLAEMQAFRRQWNGEVAFEVTVLDIEDREEWMAHYQYHVPVVVVNGEEVCHYFLDPDALENALTCP